MDKMCLVYRCEVFVVTFVFQREEVLERHIFHNIVWIVNSFHRLCLCDFLIHRKAKSVGLRAGSVSQVFAVQAGGPEFELQNSHNKARHSGMCL